VVAAIIARRWRVLRDLLADLVGSRYGRDGYGDRNAKEDDVLDAVLDDDGMDATGL